MSIHKGILETKTGNNTSDILYPKTSIDQVVGLPVPTSADSGKYLGVDSNGNFALISGSTPTGYSVTIFNNTGIDNVNIYDGQDNTGTYLGIVLVNDTETFTVTSGYLYAEWDDPFVTDDVTFAEDGSDIGNPVQVTSNMSIEATYVAPTGLLPPVISLYNNSSALKIESQNDVEDQYEIYLDDTLIGTYDKFYDFESDGNGTLTKCLGRQYYTGEIVTPQTINDVSIIALGQDLFDKTTASKITISEGVTTAPIHTFGMLTTTTTNISFPSTMSDLQSLYSYGREVVNIGLPGYIEYGWTNALPTMSSNKLFTTQSVQTVINFYAKATITSFGNYSLYIVLDATKTLNYYFDESENETITFGTNLLYVGTSKIKPTYNIYTDNASIKDTMLSYAGSNCTVNVYKRNGGSW